MTYSKENFKHWLDEYFTIEGKEVTLVEQELACCEKQIAEWNEKKKSLEGWLNEWRNIKCK